jgi:hypothetical protein
MGFKNVKAFVDANQAGAFKYGIYRKVPSQVNTAGVWFDLAMSSGNPIPQYYASSPLIGVALRRSTDAGFDHGGAVAPKTKHISRIAPMITAAASVPMILCDYLAYYPFFDDSITGELQTVTPVALPRSVDGAGVQMMAISVASRTGGATFYVQYTNQDGVPGRVSATVTQSAASANGTVISSGTSGPFIALQYGDTGVRSIDGVFMIGNDVGLFTIVLCKPLATTFATGSIVNETSYLQERCVLPRVEDDAYLNFITLPSAALNGSSIICEMDFVWN